MHAYILSHLLRLNLLSFKNMILSCLDCQRYSDYLKVDPLVNKCNALWCRRSSSPPLTAFVLSCTFVLITQSLLNYNQAVAETAVPHNTSFSVDVRRRSQLEGKPFYRVIFIWTTHAPRLVCVSFIVCLCHIINMYYKFSGVTQKLAGSAGPSAYSPQVKI